MTSQPNNPIHVPAPGHQVFDTALSRRDFARVATIAAGLAAAAPMMARAQGTPVATPQIELGPKGGTLTVARAGDADTLDPMHTIYGLSLEVLYCIYDALTGMTPDNQVEGLLAESWDISEDQKEYTFHLRQGIKFHDGTDFTSDAVKAAFDRVLDPKTQTPTASWVGPLKEVTIVDDYTVKFILAAPFSPLLPNLASGYFSIPSPTAVAKYGDSYGQNPVGTGAFKFKEWITGSTITLVPNPDYVNYRSVAVNKGAPLLDELIFSNIPEASTQMAAFETGQVQMFTPDNNSVKSLQENSDYQVLITTPAETTGTIYLEFAELPVPAGQYTATFKAPFDDLRVRQAFAYSIDADTMIANILDGLAVRNYGPMPTGLFAYKPEIEEYGYHYDPDKAKSLLKEAGWADSNGDGVVEKDGKDLSILFWGFQDPTYQKVAQVIQNQANQVGFKVDLQVVDNGTYTAQVASKPDIDLEGWGQTDPDMLRGMTNNPTLPLGRFQDKETQGYLTQALETTDQAKRTEFYFEAAKKIMADCAMVPLWSNFAVVAVRKEVKGLHEGLQTMPVYTDISIAK